MENLNIYLPDPALRAEFEEFRKLKTPEEKEVFRKKIKEEFDKKTPEEKCAYTEASQMGLQAIGDRVEELIEKVELGEVANVISMSYIAKKYFGRTRHWLYHRLNGNLVNGKPVRFTPEERQKLKYALQDVERILHDTSFKIA